MIINFYRRSFLKKSIFLFSFFAVFFSKKNFFKSLTRENKLELSKNLNFAKSKYHNETTDLIFTNFINNENSVKDIMSNIEKRRKLSSLIYKRNIKFII
tara:strand:- start:7617 stop:7913 length:297 start_codon:yes stop_codon:yes gene_type:complete